MLRVGFVTSPELATGLAYVLESPNDHGRIEMISTSGNWSSRGAARGEISPWVIRVSYLTLTRYADSSLRTFAYDDTDFAKLQDPERRRENEAARPRIFRSNVLVLVGMLPGVLLLSGLVLWRQSSEIGILSLAGRAWRRLRLVRGHLLKSLSREDQE